MGKEMKRPCKCIDKDNCNPIFRDCNNATDVAEGRGFVCAGTMEREKTFRYNNVSHANDINLCWYTPLKGVIQYHLNKNDVFMLGMFFEGLLDKINFLEKE